ncbi:SDR family oxidoreductase [Microvirga sp. M2]|uniref:SDR family oxidoreductase n=1 Tax=Microvirga sp. M2 TaxID=3073270 RepID=UPI0039C491AF
MAVRTWRFGHGRRRRHGLQGKVALVTGAGSGIGKATALRFAREGAMVGVLSHTESEIRETAEEIVRAGGKAIPLVADVADDAQMKAAVTGLVETYGRLDIVFANAGINGMWAPIDELQPEEWDRTINTNLRGTYLTLHHAVPHLKRAGGSIVITASINGSRTFTSAGATAYSATKAAQVAMAQMLAVELAKHKIRVNVVCPGRIDTEIQDNTQRRNTEEAKVPADYPEGSIPLTGCKAGTSEEVAELVLFLASDRARHITGTPVWIDGGQSLVV